jgi:hypothetical protein
MATLNLSTNEFLPIVQQMNHEGICTLSEIDDMKNMKDYQIRVESLNLKIKCWRKWIAEDGPAGMYDGHGSWDNIWHLEFETDEDLSFFTLKYI